MQEEPIAQEALAREAPGGGDTYSAHASGNVAPTNRLTSGSANALANPQGLNFDASGHLVVADAGARRVVTFAVGASGAYAPEVTGNATPTTTIVGGAAANYVRVDQITRQRRAAGVDPATNRGRLV